MKVVAQNLPGWFRDVSQCLTEAGTSSALSRAELQSARHSLYALANRAAYLQHMIELDDGDRSRSQANIANLLK